MRSLWLGDMGQGVKLVASKLRPWIWTLRSHIKPGTVRCVCNPASVVRLGSEREGSLTNQVGAATNTLDCPLTSVCVRHVCAYTDAHIHTRWKWTSVLRMHVHIHEPVCVHAAPSSMQESQLGLNVREATFSKMWIVHVCVFTWI